eukprot:366230-Chlamydomonas_euryale.AAC.21
MQGGTPGFLAYVLVLVNQKRRCQATDEAGALVLFRAVVTKGQIRAFTQMGRVGRPALLKEVEALNFGSCLIPRVEVAIDWPNLTPRQQRGGLWRGGELLKVQASGAPREIIASPHALNLRFCPRSEELRRRALRTVPAEEVSSAAMQASLSCRQASSGRAAAATNPHQQHRQRQLGACRAFPPGRRAGGGLPLASELAAAAHLGRHASLVRTAPNRGVESVARARWEAAPAPRRVGACAAEKADGAATEKSDDRIPVTVRCEAATA